MITDLEQTAIDITRLGNNRESVACLGVNSKGHIEAFRSNVDSIDAIWKCIMADVEPMIVANYATVEDDRYVQGEYHYII